MYFDQKSLKYLLQQRITTVDQQHWIAKLLPYYVVVIYKSRPKNDALLFHRYEEGELREITLSSPL